MISNLPEGWREVKLEELCKENSGMYGINESAVEYDLNLYRYLRITDIKDEGTIDENKRVSVNIKRDTESKYLLNKNDIVFARTGASAGRNYFYTGKEGPMIFAGFLIKFSLDESKVIPEYIKYHCQSREYNDWIKAISTGSTRPNINAKMYNNMKIDLPPVEQQKLLVDTLSALDNKIELNNNINENLEKQAQAIFKHWFIDFEFPDENGNPYKSSGGEMVESELGMIPKGWEVGGIKDMTILSHTGGDAIKTAPIVDYNTGIKCARVGDLSQNRPINEWSYCKINEANFKKYKLEKGDVLVTRTASLGLNKMINKSENAVFNNGLIRLRFRSDYELSYIKYIFDNKQFMNYINMITGDSSTRPNMKIKYLLSYKIAIAPRKLQKEYHIIVNLMINNIQLNLEQNQKLAKLRDTLLPKLMSGELRIPLD